MSETEALTRFDAFLWKQVHSFKRATSCAQIDEDDLIQEARLAFLQHIRTHRESEWAACTRTIRRAMFDSARRAHHMKIPHHAFFQWLKQDIAFVPVEGCLQKLEADQVSAELITDLHALTGIDQQIVSMRWYGYELEEIGEAVGMTGAGVSMRLKRLWERMSA